MRRKILMGVLALALPAGIVAGTTTVASAKSPTPNPISCNHFGTTITFTVPYTLAGVATSSKTGGSTTVASAGFPCAVGTGTFPNITIPPGKNSKLAKTDPRYNKTTGVKYVEGTTASFISGGGKALKKSLKTINFTINGHATLFKTAGTPTLVTGNAPCPGEVGYVINGKVDTGSPFYYDKTAVLDVCLGADHGTSVSGNFLGDLLNTHFAGTITSASIDPANGNATL